MKTLLKKLWIAILIISFTIQPILQIVMGIGEVQAATTNETVVKRYVTTNTNRTEELNTKIDPITESARIYKTEYRYTVYYTKTFSLPIMEDDFYLFSVGKAIGTTNNSNLGTVTIKGLTKGNATSKLTKTGSVIWSYKKWYSCRVTLGGSYKTDWTTQSKTKDSFSSIKVSHNSNGYTINQFLLPQSITNTETRYTWEVTSKIPQTNKDPDDSPIKIPQTNTNPDDSPIKLPQTNTDPDDSSNDTSSSGSSNSSTQTETMSQKVNKLNDNAKKLYIRSLYKRVLGREPSNNEIAAHFNSTVQSIATNIIFSTESKNRNKIDNMSNEEFVKACYTYILGRTGDTSGISNHTQSLNKGTTRQNLVKAFIESAEFLNKTNKNTTTITLNENLCSACYTDLKNDGYAVIKPTNTTIIMYQDDVEKVSSLDISGKGLTDLTGVSNFSNIKTLLAQDNNISNLDEISKLTKLEKLQLANNSSIDISKITSLATLKELNLNNCNIKNNVSYIWNLTNLEKLYLANNGIVNTYINNNIDKLTNLQVLTLDNNSITSLNSISNLTKLTTLSVNNNNISYVGNIGNSTIKTINVNNNALALTGASFEYPLPDILKKAEEENNILYASNNIECVNCKIENDTVIIDTNAKVATITIKSGVASGTKLTITNNVQEISCTDKVLADKLQTQLGVNILSRIDENGKYNLYISQEKIYQTLALDLSTTSDDTAKITNITGLEKFVNLQILNLENNKVENLDKLAELTKIKTLNISHNGLTNLSKIANVKSLTQLDASNNSINDISDISNLTNLTTVILSNNNIGNNLKPLDSLSNLSTLSISNNSVSNLSNISSLNLTTLYTSYNKTADISAINTEDLQTLDAKNNSVTINVETSEVELPSILNYAIEKNGGIDNLEFTNCSISNNKIVLDEGKKVAQIKVKDGSLSDTIITIQMTGDVTPPELSVDYKLNNETGKMDVTITSNEKIERPSGMGWVVAEDKTKATKSYTYNTKENLRISDLYGNETVQEINVTGVTCKEIPGLAVYYSSYSTSPTNEDVTVTVTADEEIGLYMESNYRTWTLSEDGKMLQATFSGPSHGSIMIATKENLDEIRNNNASNEGRVIYFGYSVEHIDKDAPVCEVEYSESSSTKSSVIATIWSDEEIMLANDLDNFVSKVTKLDEQGNTKYGVSLYYADNTQGNVIISDLAGNTTTVPVNITNIDNGVDGLYTAMNATSATNQAVTLTVGSNENIKVVNETETQSSAKDESKIYVGAIDVTKIATIINEIPVRNELSYTLAGDMNVIPVMDGYTELVKSESMVFLSETSSDTTILVSENTNTTVSGSENSNQLQYELTEGGSGIIEVTDQANNTDVAIYNAGVIDQDAPVVYRADDIVNEDGSITVTITANEEIVKTEELVDWELSEDRMSLVKTFNINKNETLQIKDLAGNTTEFEVEVETQKGIEYKVLYETIEGTEQVLVVIEADIELVELDGWELSEDGKHLGKVFDISEKATITIEDITGNSQEVYIDYLGDEEITEDNGNEENNENDGSGAIEDNTQSDKELPQTGKYSIISGTLIIVLTILTIFVLVYDHKKYSKL